MGGNSFERSMSQCRPGYAVERGEFTTAANAAASAVIYTVPVGVVDGVYWVRVGKVGNVPTGDDQQVRLQIGPAIVTTPHQCSDEGRVALGPLNAGDTIEYWRDCGAGIIIQYARIS